MECTNEDLDARARTCGRSQFRQLCQRILAEVDTGKRELPVAAQIVAAGWTNPSLADDAEATIATDAARQIVSGREIGETAWLWNQIAILTKKNIL